MAGDRDHFGGPPINDDWVVWFLVAIAVGVLLYCLAWLWWLLNGAP